MDVARLHAYHAVMTPLQRRFRKARMRLLEAFLTDFPGTPRILDLGGTPMVWQMVDRPMRIEMLNLPGHVIRREDTRHDIAYVEGDACDLSAYGDGAFDLVFSNSVIEHVGGRGRRDAFAREARRVGRGLWVQTPAKNFPVDPHTGMPFWWHWPDGLRERTIARWREKLPAWTEMVEETTFVPREELEENFPDCELITERFLLMPKSYIVRRRP